MRISVPDLSLVVLIGPSGSGTSTLARKHFRPTDVLSSDACRGLVGDDENDQAVTKEAFEVLHHVAARRVQRSIQLYPVRPRRRPASHGAGAT